MIIPSFLFPTCSGSLSYGLIFISFVILVINFIQDL